MFRGILIFVSLVGFSVADPPKEPTPGSINLYYTPGSAPCRSVLLLAKILKLELVLHRVDLLKGEHLTKEYLKINPEHKIPYLVDEDGNRLRQSHAILIYLAEKYEASSLYPKDTYTHALINERLFTDASDLYASFTQAYYPLIQDNLPITDKRKNKLAEAIRLFDLFLEKNNYAGGDDFSVADCSFLATITTIEAVNYDISKYTNIVRWLKNVKTRFTETEYKEANEIGVKMYQDYYLREMEKWNRKPDGDHGIIGE